MSATASGALVASAGAAAAGASTAAVSPSIPSETSCASSSAPPHPAASGRRSRTVQIALVGFMRVLALGWVSGSMEHVIKKGGEGNTGKTREGSGGGGALRVLGLRVNADS